MTPTPCSIHVPLLSNETATNDPASWPAVVQQVIARELDLWAQANPSCDIVDQSFDFDAGRRVCVTRWHVAERGTA